MERQKIRFGVIGDPHIKRNTIPESMKMVDAVVEWVTREDFDFVTVMGDTLDRFGDIRVEPLCVAVDELADRLVDLCHVYWLIGNHDMSNNSNFLTKKHPFTAFRRWKGLTLCDTVVHSTVKGVQFTFCPYVPEGRFVEALNTNPGWEKSRIIFSHQTYREAKMGMARSKTGDVWDLSFPYNISGHMHDYDQLQSNVLYVGAPMELAYGEGRRTVSGFVLGADDVLVEERVDLHLPRRHHFKVAAADVLSFIPPEQGVIKITIIGTVPENLAVKKLSVISEWKARGIKVGFKDLKIERPTNLLLIEEDNTSVVRYRDALYQEASKDPIMLSIYHSLYTKANLIQS